MFSGLLLGTGYTSLVSQRDLLSSLALPHLALGPCLALREVPYALVGGGTSFRSLPCPQPLIHNSCTLDKADREEMEMGAELVCGRDTWASRLTNPLMAEGFLECWLLSPDRCLY